MRGSSVGWGLVIIGSLGVFAYIGSDFLPSKGLMFTACVIAVLGAFWAQKMHSEPSGAYSPLLGKRRRLTPTASPRLLLPVAAVSIWLFAVFGAGMILVRLGGTEHTRMGVVLYNVGDLGSTRSRRDGCSTALISLHKRKKPIEFRQCDVGPGALTLAPGMPVTYRTRESPLGTLLEPRFRLLDTRSIKEVDWRSR